MNRHLSMLKLAANQARRFSHDLRYHLCAIIAQKNRIISIGFNKMKTHRMAKNPYHYIHAELDAILGLDAKELIGSTMYVVRVGHIGRSRLMLAKPCIYCQSAIVGAGIKEVYYSISDESELYGYWNLKNGKELLLKKCNDEFITTFERS